MGNGASLLSPGKSRRQRAQPADAPVEATVAVNAADKNPEQANKEEAPIAKKEDTQIVGIESPELELNDLAHELEDAGEFISFKGSPIEFLKQAGGDPYSDYSLALALEMEQDFQHASRLFASLRGHPSLGLSAHYHFAVCLLLIPVSIGPSDGRNEQQTQEEVLRCLEHVVASDGDIEDAEWRYIHRHSKELLAHILVTRREFIRALGLFTEIHPTSGTDPRRIQPSNNDGFTRSNLDAFNHARCLHATGDVAAAITTLNQIDWRAMRAVLPHVAADAAGIASALVNSLDQS